jgi:hypothetical protein
VDQVMKVVDEWRDRIEDHPLHHWLVADDGVQPERKLWFSLYFANFIMYFRELNLYHISYRDDRSLDAHRESLSAHADEDMTHSKLFMRDFKTLGWDDLLGWRPSEVLHWLFSSEVNAHLRRRTTAITKLVIEAQDPMVRYAVVESIEACGNALFRHTERVAERYAARTGRELVYWGAFHLARETGHAVDDDAFDGVVLSPSSARLRSAAPSGCTSSSTSRTATCSGWRKRRSRRTVSTPAGGGTPCRQRRSTRSRGRRSSTSTSGRATPTGANRRSTPS